MSDNYVVINGKRIELTDEQVKALGIERKNPFERVADGNPYYYIATDNYIHSVHENYDQCNYDAYYDVNYFNDKDFANQVSLHQLLYRKLLKFAYNNECEDTLKWDGRNAHWVIRYNKENDTFTPDWHKVYKMQEVYFSSAGDANCAIREVIEPFMKEHPEFVW